MLKLKPSARKNNRYLLIRGKKEDIEKSILDYIGILGWGKADPVFISQGDKCILAVNRKELNNVKAAFAISQNKIEILRVSGTLKGLSK